MTGRPKRLSPQVRWMIALIVMLAIGVWVRWAFVSREAGEAFRQRIEKFSRP